LTFEGNDRKMIRKRIKFIMIPLSGMKDRNMGFGIIKEILTVEQQEAVNIFLSFIFLSLLS